MIDDRIQREISFHNQRFDDPSRRQKKVGAFYKITSSLRTQYRLALLEECGNANVLEYGCGTGSSAFALAKAGAFVNGIDISRVALDIAEARAKAEKVEKRTNFQLMNAEQLAFASQTFDLVCGNGILHHVNLHNALLEVGRVLRPNGKAIFTEPLGHNILINTFRRLTPNIRTVDEHPLLDADLKNMNRYFGKVQLDFFYLTALATTPFVGLFGFQFLLNASESVDRFLFRFPFVRRQAWQVMITLSEPVA